MKLPRFYETKDWSNIKKSIQECNKILKNCKCDAVHRENRTGEDILELCFVNEKALQYEATFLNFIKNVEFYDAISHLVEKDELEELTPISKSELKKWAGAYDFAKETPELLLKFLQNKEVQEEFMGNGWEVDYTDERGFYELVFFANNNRDPKVLAGLLKSHSDFGKMYKISIEGPAVSIK